jgi:hypothetical protein
LFPKRSLTHQPLPRGNVSPIYTLDKDSSSGEVYKTVFFKPVMKINDRPRPTYQQVINMPAFSPRQQRHGFNSQDRGREQGKKDE